MSFSSSPVRYARSSSPPMAADAPHKRRKLDYGASMFRKPLSSVVNEVAPAEKLVGGFLDDSDEEEALHEEQHGQTSSQPASQATATTTPLAVDDEDGLDKGHVDLPNNTESDLRGLQVQLASGRTHTVFERRQHDQLHYSKIVEQRSVVDPSRAQRSYYGVDIHHLVDMARKEMENQKAAREEAQAAPTPSIEAKPASLERAPRTLLWTEKYRARKFTDLIGDERTHRSVLRWLKAWDSIVFPGAVRAVPKHANKSDDQERERAHRKILMLTGPPGLGKTTLAHVCAKQAGYEVQEINASDERSSNVVKNRIRDMVATENVRPVGTSTNVSSSKPVCVVVDEVDGVVTGNNNAGGEGGFMKALVDLLILDQKNSTGPATSAGTGTALSRGKKRDKFRMLRPIILICNDVYHPSLRQLRQSSFAEVIHVRKPPINLMVPRMQAIFVKEGIPADSDGVRQLCEAAWGVSNRKEEKHANAGVGDGDIRSILVLAEWVAGKLRASGDESLRLSKRWLALNVLQDLAHGGDSARSLGRGGPREVVDRIFLHNAGFPAKAPGNAPTAHLAGGAAQALTHADIQKRDALVRLKEMADASGDDDRIVTDMFTTYPTRPFQDTTVLTKPAMAYEWLHFHALCSSAVHQSQSWDMAPYLSYPICAFHNLFASASRTAPAALDTFTEPADVHPLETARAPYVASETQKSNHATLAALFSSLALPLQRCFRGPNDLATELVPYLLRVLNPDVKPVVVSGVASVRRGPERERLARGAGAMLATGVRFDKVRVEDLAGGEGRQTGGWAYRMAPAVDELGLYATGRGKAGSSGYGVRAALARECEVSERAADADARNRRGGVVGVAAETPSGGAKVVEVGVNVKIKRDFFGRALGEEKSVAVAGGKKSIEAISTGEGIRERDEAQGRVWVTFNEGFSNAVRRGIGMGEFLAGL